jgi:hypothetical protein
MTKRKKERTNGRVKVTRYTIEILSRSNAITRFESAISFDDCGRKPTFKEYAKKICVIDVVVCHCGHLI